DRSAQQGGVSASARSKLDCTGRQPGVAFQPHLVSDLGAKRLGQFDERAYGVTFSVNPPDFVGLRLFLWSNNFIRGQNAFFFRRILQRELEGMWCEQKVERIFGPELKFQLNTNLQNFSWFRKKTIGNQIIKQIAAILDIALQVDCRVMAMRND